MNGVSKTKRNGFTLVEAVMAIGITGVGVVAVFGTISSTTEGAGIAAEEVAAMALAQDLMAETNTRPFSAVPVVQPARIGEHLAVYYTFSDGSGNYASDESGISTLHHLHLANDDAAWMPGTNGVSINEGGALNTSTGAGKVLTACAGTAQVSVEIWFETAEIGQDERPIFCMANSNAARNFLLVQSGSRLVFYLLVHSGGTISLETPADTLAVNRMTHFVATYDGSNLRLFVNATLAAERSLSGSFNNWQEYPLRMAAVPGYQDGWQGRVFLEAVYYRALTAAQVTQNHQAGPSPAGLYARTGYNSIDDYRNFTDDPPRAEDGSLIPGAEGFRRTAEVVSVSPGNLTAQQAWNSTDAKTISVSIYKGNRLAARLVAARFKNVPP